MLERQAKRRALWAVHPPGGVNTKNLCVIKHIATEATLADVIPQNGWTKTL